MALTSNTKTNIAKTFLWVLGFVVTMSVFWKYILQGFGYGSGKPVEWSSTDTYLTVAGFIFLVGASQFTSIVEAITSRLGKYKITTNTPTPEADIQGVTPEPPYPQDEP